MIDYYWNLYSVVSLKYIFINIIFLSTYHARINVPVWKTWLTVVSTFAQDPDFNIFLLLPLTLHRVLASNSKQLNGYTNISVGKIATFKTQMKVKFHWFPMVVFTWILRELILAWTSLIYLCIKQLYVNFTLNCLFYVKLFMWNMQWFCLCIG